MKTQYIFENQHLDIVGRNENKWVLYIAYKNDSEKKIIGYIDYTTIHKDLYVDFVEVDVLVRRKGVAKALYKELHRIQSDFNFKRASSYTENGSKVRSWFEKEILDLHVLSRDEKPLYHGSANECFKKLARIQSQSWDWAIKYEGYAVTPMHSL